MPFPSLVGGIILRAYDLIPSIIFAAVYGLLLPVHIYRMVDRRTRTFVISQSVGFVIERTIIFCLRAVVASQSNTESDQGLTEYMQLTIGTGFLAMAGDFASLLRSILVNSTNKSESAINSHVPELISLSSRSSWSWKLDKPPSILPDLGSGSPEAALPDQPRRRFWFRRICDGFGIWFLAALVSGLVGNSRLIHQKDDERGNRENQALRYASTTMALLGILGLGAISALARYKMPRVKRRATSFLIVFSLLLAIPAIYRLAVMHNTTSSSNLYSTAPGSLNTRGAKTLFYVFHILPEWIAAAMLACLNVRETFQTGLKGDSRWRDETQQEREKREQAEREKEIRKEKRREWKRKREFKWNWKAVGWCRSSDIKI